MAGFDDSTKDGGKVKKWLDGATRALVTKLKDSKDPKDPKDSKVY
jgi:hypothetical protein